MTSDEVTALIAVCGMITGVMVTWGIAWGVVQSFRSRHQAAAGSGAVGEELDALRGQLDHLQRQLDEAHERIDFTERMLSQPRSPEQLPRGAP